MELQFFYLDIGIKGILLFTFVLSIIIFLILFILNKYYLLYKSLNIQEEKFSKEDYISKINSIDFLDVDFASNLNKVIKGFLSDINYCKLAPYFTKNELSKYINNQNAQKLFEIIEKLEYSMSKSISEADFKILKTNVINLINSF